MTLTKRAEMARIAERQGAGGPDVSETATALTETIVEDPRWEDSGLIALAERAADATLRHSGLDPARHQIAVLGCDDARIAALNGAFRDTSRPTNVLSWPSVDLASETPGARPALPAGPDAELGDIAIAFETCAREAAAQGKPLADHVTHLIVHATLHLLGYDHLRDKDATLMEATEVEILGKLGLSDPY